MHAEETERLEVEQDRIEWHLGLERPADVECLEAAQDAIELELGADGRPGFRKWSCAR
jgi:hypothetical protein